MARISAIDGLRGIAILAVIYQHLFAAAVMEWVRQRTGSYPWLIGNGWMGVQLFFILSGFVLALPYFTNNRPLNFWWFLSHRLKRLGPLFLVICVISFSFSLHAGAPEFRSFLLTVTTLNILTSSEFFPTINGPLWSLAIEIWFCVLFLPIVWAMQKYGVAKTIACICIGALVIRCFGAYFTFVNVHINPIKDSAFARADDFSIGAGIAYLYSKNKLPRLDGRHALAGLALLIIAGALWDLRVQALIYRLPSASFNNIQQIGFSLIFIAALAPTGRTTSALSGWTLRLIGAMCFSIYCWHALLLSPRIQGNPFDASLQLAFWTTLFALSAVTYRYIEFPRSNAKDIFLINDIRNRLPLVMAIAFMKLIKRELASWVSPTMSRYPGPVVSIVCDACGTNRELSKSEALIEFGDVPIREAADAILCGKVRCHALFYEMAVPSEFQ